MSNQYSNQINPQYGSQNLNEIQYQNIQYQNQIQIQRQKMLLEQAQKLRNCHEILMKLLFSAENYALGKSKHKIFGEYDRYDNTSNKTPLQLKYQFVEQLDIFNNAYNYYSQLYPGKFILPEGLDQNYLYKTILQWKSKFNGKPEEEYYDLLIKLINGKKIRSLYIDMEQIDSEIINEKKKYLRNINMQKRNEIDIQNFMNNYAEASHYTDEYLKNVSVYYDTKTGQYIYKVKLGGDPGKGLKDIK